MSDLVNGKYALKERQWLLHGKPSGLPIIENMDRLDIASDLSALSTGVALAVAIPVDAGRVISKIGFKSGGTAAGTPTHYFFSLYDANGNLLSQSADQTTTAWAADTLVLLPLATPQAIAASGVVYADISVTATTPPTLVGVTLPRAALSTGILTTDLILARTHGSGLTATAPATIASATAVATVPYVVVQ